ncbi:MAG TPA: HEPN domain-containing protein [Candidatus Nanoarchaeia archaeon]|nr:HEPN domain-containing protein [Candidatus Nanoarchaeia archaeon]
MKKAGFLARLKKEKKIQAVEPSEEIKTAYLQRSEESLRSAKALLQINNLKDAVALAYYSMYYSLLALLFRIGIKCENHTGAIMLLKEIFDIDNRKISAAKKERVDKQYYVDFSVTKEEVTDMITITEEFNSQLLYFIDNLNQNKIKEYQERVAKILSLK